MRIESDQTKALKKEAQMAREAANKSSNADLRLMSGKFVKAGNWFIRCARFTEDSKFIIGGSIEGISVHDSDIPSIHVGSMGIDENSVEIEKSEFDAAFVRAVEKLKDIFRIQ